MLLHFRTLLDYLKIIYSILEKAVVVQLKPTNLELSHGVLIERQATAASARRLDKYTIYGSYLFIALNFFPSLLILIFCCFSSDLTWACSLH